MRVTGTLGCASGQGVHGRLVSSSRGELGSWSIRQGKIAVRVEPIAVQRGDTLDFLVEAQGDTAAFLWAPHLRILDVPPGEIAGLRSEWKAESDFRGPPKPLSAWEKYAQVLLMANEFAHDN